MDTDRLPLAEAAQRLGISVTACRKRVARGTLDATKHDGQWYIRLPGGEATATRNGEDAGSPPESLPGSPPAALLSTLQGEVDWLRSELEARRREVERLHTLLAQAQSRPQLPTAERTEPDPPAVPKRAPWWRRLFGQSI